MDCGIFGTTYIFDVLHAHGQDAVALEVLTETTFPSLGRMVQQGATTLWEGWDGSRNVIGSTGTSRNHIMFGGGVARYLLASVGGLSPSQTGSGKTAGWHRLLLGPAPAAARLLTRGGARRQTPSGMVVVSWRRVAWRVGDHVGDSGEGGSGHSRLVVNVTVPSLSTATVRVPLLDHALAVVTHRRSGTLVGGDGGEVQETQTGERVFFAEVGPGEHSFETATAALVSSAGVVNTEISSPLKL